MRRLWRALIRETRRRRQAPRADRIFPPPPRLVGRHLSASTPATALFRHRKTPKARSRNGFPTTNRSSTDSTVTGILKESRRLVHLSMSRTMVIPVPTASTRSRHGTHPQSIGQTAAPWFSNTPEAPTPGLPKNAAKRNLGKAVWKAMLAANEFDRQNQKRPSRHWCCLAFFFFAHCTLGTFYSILRFFPRLQSGHLVFQRPSPPKQIPSR
jgi:hypothetical protein